MKIYFLLILTAITLSFSTAYFALNLEKNNLASKFEIAEINALERDFELRQKPLTTLDLSSMYPSRDFFQLIHPIVFYSKNNEINSNNVVSRPCNKTTDRMSKLSSDKNEVWEDFRCLRISKLPETFFASPPLIHDSGVSYAYFAFLSGREPFGTQEWVVSHINFFHVSELKNLPITGLDANFKILSQLEKDDFESLEKGSKYILSNDYFLIKKENVQDIVYAIFKKIDFENYLKNKIFYIKAFQTGNVCFYKEGAICWEKNSNNILEIYKKSSIIIFLVSMLVLFLISIILFKKIKMQKYEEERKRHALRVLTHELRTPISNLLLQVEMINKQSTQIPPSLIEDFLKMEGEVYRLKRLAEKSSSYLETHEGKSLIALEHFLVPSINSLIEEMLETYTDKKCQFVPLKSDLSINVDAYWLNICLKNLVENAFIHGGAPVSVELGSDKEFIKINVINNGSCSFNSLDEMINSNRSSKTSAGLGVGLSIVQRIMLEMKGKILFSKNPTAFTLFLRRNL